MTASATSTDSGFTGTAAAPSIVFNSLFVEEPIPTGIELPCSGNGSAAFVPAPAGTTARTATVTVTFENIAL